MMESKILKFSELGKDFERADFMTTEKEKMLTGEMYDAADPQLTEERRHARDLCKTLNESPDNEQELRQRIIRKLFGSAGDAVWI